MSWEGLGYVADRLFDQVGAQQSALWLRDSDSTWRLAAQRGVSCLPQAPNDLADCFEGHPHVMSAPSATLAVSGEIDPEWAKSCLDEATAALATPALLDRAQRSEAMFAGVLEAISDQAAILDEQGIVIRSNSAWEQAPASHRSVMERSAIGTDYVAGLRAQDSRPARLAAEGIKAVLAGVLPSFQSDYDTDVDAGDRSYSLQVDRLETAGAVVRHVDISFRKHLQRELAHRATHDPLTGLPNRMVLIDRLGQAMIRAARTQRLLAVMFCDVDRFKLINDIQGHAVGDKVLSAVGRRLQTSVAQSDLVARFGGDEFVVLLEDIEDASAARDSAQRLQSTATRPIVEDGQELTFGLSIGVAVHAGSLNPTPPAISDLLADADTAMYAAKASGRGGIYLHMT